MNWSATILSTITSDTEPSIVIEFDSARYIFNVGENANRAFMQGTVSWKKAQGLFLTSVGTQRASGLAGLLMTLADGSASKVDVIGPEGLTHFLAAMRKYTFRDSFVVKPIEIAHTMLPQCTADHVYKDDNVSVYALPIMPAEYAPQQSSPTQTAHEISSTSKRKREHPSDQPSKRLHRSNQSITPDRYNVSLEALMNTPDFSPRVLDGHLAQEWRQMMVRTMFSGKMPTPNERVKQKEMAEKAAQDVVGAGKQFKQSSRVAYRPSDTRIDTASPFMEQGVGSSPSFTPIPIPIPIPIQARHAGSNPAGFDAQLPPFAFARHLRNLKNFRSTLAYAIVGPQIRGKFDAAKATALGVPNGPQRRELTCGREVTFTVKVDGVSVERTVKPEEVMGPSEDPSAVLILDIPSLDHVAALPTSFQGSRFFSQFRSPALERQGRKVNARVVFHLCGEGVLEDERYISFINSLGPDIQHVIASREHGEDPVTFTSAAYNQLRLNQLDPEMFRLPVFCLHPLKSLRLIRGLPANIELMRANARHSVRPTQPSRYDKLAEEKDLFHPAMRSDTTLKLPPATLNRFTSAQAAAKEIAMRRSSPKPGDDVLVTPLGTSSAVPSKFRNVSSTLIQVPGWGGILLDAGEGTWGQLARHFGLDTLASRNVWSILRQLKCIFISHIHADHHIGLAKILSMRRCLNPPPSEPLHVIAHSNVFLYLHEYAEVEDLGLDDEFGVKCILSDAIDVRHKGKGCTFGDEFPWLEVQNSHNLMANLNQSLGLKRLATVEVRHTSKCHGLFIEHNDGWSIVFSGDTVPAESLVRAGQHATLLIHEASLADDQVTMAKAKRHSTFGQAVDVGIRMKAQNILLNHFSARYPVMPPQGTTNSSSRSDSGGPNLALAFDLADVAIGDMQKLNVYLPAIEQSFRDTEEHEDSHKAQ